MRAWWAVPAIVLMLGCASQRAEEFNATGIQKLKAEDAVAAAAEFGKAVKLAPDVAKYHYNLGLAFFKLRQADEASRHFQEALRIDPGDADASRMLSLSNTAIAMRTRSY